MGHLNTAYKLGATQAQQDFDKKADAAQQARIRARMEENPSQRFNREWGAETARLNRVAPTKPNTVSQTTTRNGQVVSRTEAPIRSQTTSTPKPVAPPLAPKPSPVHAAPIGTSHATPTTAPKPPMPQQTPVQMPTAASSGRRATPEPAPKPVTIPKTTPPPTPKTTAEKASPPANRPVSSMGGMGSML